jgi:hypothetical protein
MPHGTGIYVPPSFWKTLLDPESLEPTCERVPSVIELTPCPVCREWLPHGSKRLRQCLACEAWI